MTWIVLFLLGSVLLVLVRAALLGNELFRIRARAGEIELARGRLPPELFDEIADVVRLHRVRSGDIRAVLSGGRAKLVFEHDGSSAAAAQPLRNVLGRFTVRQIRSGRRHVK